MLTPVTIAQALTATFTAILFLQSGADKVLDFSGNLSWLKEYFSKTLLAGATPILFALLTVTELAAGIFSAMGVIHLLVNGDKAIAQLGVELAALAFVALLFGQRMAKDYTASANTAGYFGMTLVGLLVMLQ